MKSSTVYVCDNCGYDSSKWLGKCPACNEWNTFKEMKNISKSGSKSKSFEKNDAVELKSIDKKDRQRIKTDIEELDRVLGGGFVVGSLTLIRR